MKILIVINSSIGLYKFRKELIEELIKSNVVFLSLPKGKYIDYFEKIGCHYYECEFDRHGTNPFQEARQISYYKHLLNIIQPDAVLTYTIKPNIYCGIACASLKIPCIANITGLGTAIENKGLLQIITLVLYKYGLRKNKKVFFQNTENRDFMLKRNIINSSYDVLPGSGVNLVQHKYEEYPSSDTAITFLFIGRIMRDKGFTELVEAARVIKNKYPDVSFKAIGSCEKEYEEQLALINKDLCVELLGQQDDVHKFIQDCHAVILPSYHEGMANVLLEAAATGRPVLASNIPGCKETFDEGQSGIGFMPRNVQSLCEAIEKFIELSYEDKKNMGIQGRKKAENQFDREIIVQAYVDEISKIKTEEIDYNVL